MSPPGEEPAGRDDAFVALVTGPDREGLIELSRRVVEERLAACVNVVDPIVSVYRWEGRVETEEESLAILKTTAARVDALRDRVLELHPYDEPEFVALVVERGSHSYLRWVAESVAGGEEG